MATSKLELAVDTGKWDAGLRKGQQALNAFINAQGGLQQAIEKDNGQMQKFIQMVGKMDSTASTAKGQMNDYKRVLEQLTNDYNMMSDAQKKSIGQDYLSTIDQLRNKFHQAKQQVEEFNRSLGETSGVKLPSTDGGGIFGGGNWNGALQVLGGNLMTKGITIAASALTNFASGIGECVKQGIELARQGEGIRNAFERLGRGDILVGLREATHGTVSDLELMKAAVKFNDFKLPVEELGTMLAFAQQKAKETGQSVDYMVDSIVTGLGRKSLMILDNLGLSAAEIKEKMAETGDMTKAVGAIIREQMAKAGDYVETAADRAEQANVSLQNKMEELGRKLAPLQEASNNLWTSMKIGILDVIGGPLETLLNELTEAGRQMNTLNRMQGGGNGQSTRTESDIAQFMDSDNKLAAYNNIRSSYDFDIIARRAELKRNEDEYKENLKVVGRDPTGQRAVLVQYETTKARLEREIASLEKMKATVTSAMKNMIKPAEIEVKTGKAVKDVSELQSKLRELEAERKKAVLVGDEEQVENLTKQINSAKQNIGYLDPNALKTTTNSITKVLDGSIDAQTAKVQELQKAWRAAADDDSRLKIKKEIEEQQYIFDRMTGKETFDPSRMTAIKGMIIVPEIKLEDPLKRAQQTLETTRVEIEAEIKADATKVDTTTLHTLLKDAIQSGIDDGLMNMTFAGIGDQIAQGINVPDEAWQKILDQYNALREQIGLEPISLDFKTGGIETSTKEKGDSSLESSQKLVSGLSSVSSGLQQMGVNIPDGVQKLMGGIQGLMTVIQGVQSVISIFNTTTATAQALATNTNTAAMTALTSAVIANTAAVATNTVTPSFFSGGGVVHAASGYVVPGTHFSGDMVPSMLNSGETVLNVGQTRNVANVLQNAMIAADKIRSITVRDSELEMADAYGIGSQIQWANAANGGSGGGSSRDFVRGQNIYLGANNYLRGNGQGQLVTTRMLRQYGLIR